MSGLATFHVCPHVYTKSWELYYTYYTFYMWISGNLIPSRYMRTRSATCVIRHESAAEKSLRCVVLHDVRLLPISAHFRASAKLIHNSDGRRNSTTARGNDNDRMNDRDHESREPSAIGKRTNASDCGSSHEWSFHANVCILPGMLTQ